MLLEGLTLPNRIYIISTPKYGRTIGGPTPKGAESCEIHLIIKICEQNLRWSFSATSH